MLLLACLLASAAAAPATYDQRQDGELNVRADVQNVVLLVAVPQKMPNIPLGFLDGLLKSPVPESEWQERSDLHVMEAFVEPSTPYHVEIGEPSDYEGGGRAVEVVIAGRRRLGSDTQADDDYKLLGATEQCGPDRERDPDTLRCRVRSQSSDAVSSPPQDEAPVDNNLQQSEKPSQTLQPEVVPAVSS